jgi:hypothetical protein
VLGSDALAGDRLARLIDFGGLADRQWEHLSNCSRGARASPSRRAWC